MMAVSENVVPESKEMERGPEQCCTFIAMRRAQSLFPGWSLSAFALQHQLLLFLDLID